MRYLLKRILLSCGLLTGLIVLSACAPEVGSERWCAAMEEKPKGDWTANEALDYGKHCLIE
ncbi:MAG: DUF3012 domain-containing protein [Pseudomonadota bacterium]